MMQKFILLVFVLFCFGGSLSAQELNATVTINAPQLTQIDPKVMEDFEDAVNTFLNTNRFTDEYYAPEERITTNFTFTLTQEVSQTEFVVDLLVQSARPVYGSDYQSTLMNWLDNSAVIQYEQFQPLEYSKNNFTTPLVALLSFYANIIIGLDKDTFSPMAGTAFYREAEQIVSTIPAGIANRDKSWGANGGLMARYRLLQEIQNPRARPYRQLLYDYHRQGLDVMATDPVAGRAIMGTSLEALRKIRSDIPNSLLISNFSASKTQEIVDVFLPAPIKQRQAAYQVMASIDPSNINKFRMLR